VSPFLSLIIPAFNEEGRLAGTLQKINDFIKTQPYACEVLVIENGSTDRTFAIARYISSLNVARGWRLSMACSRLKANTA
jgi:dolichyl-phosphate beta-glucosyltransferase